ncbi:hypothetical protein [Orbus mooreae]|uniref:hypothetical protein n=1 Tax=Orbus mooreae TaxID=3074107 RepID=UPI00370DD2A7
MQNKTLTFILGLFGLIGAIILCVAIYSLCTTYRSDISDYYVLLGMGVVFLLIGVVPLIMSIRRKNLNAQLLQTGRAIQAKVTSVEFNQALTVNGRNPFVIYCQWSDPLASNTLYLFRSGNIWFNPSDFIKNETVTVYIDENNPKNYYVDLTFLPQVV